MNRLTFKETQKQRLDLKQTKRHKTRNSKTRKQYKKQTQTINKQTHKQEDSKQTNKQTNKKGHRLIKKLTVSKQTNNQTNWQARICSADDWNVNWRPSIWSGHLPVQRQGPLFQTQGIQNFFKKWLPTKCRNLRLILKPVKLGILVLSLSRHPNEVSCLPLVLP